MGKDGLLWGAGRQSSRVDFIWCGDCSVSPLHWAHTPVLALHDRAIVAIYMSACLTGPNLTPGQGRWFSLYVPFPNRDAGTWQAVE